MTTADDIPTASTTVARNIRMWIGAHQITYAALSEATGIPPRTLMRMAKGESSISIDQIVSVSQGLGVAPTALLDGVL